MNHSETIKQSLGRMEDHELIDRCKQGFFSEEAAPLVEQELTRRGLDPKNLPKEAADSAPRAEDAPPKSKLAPVLFCAIAGPLLGAPLGTFIAGDAVGTAIAAGLGAGAAAAAGYYIGKVLSSLTNRANSKVKRRLILFSASLLWLVFCSVAGLLLKLMAG